MEIKRPVYACDVKRHIQNRVKNETIVGWLCGIVDEVYTANTVEVVRCKECKWWQESVDGITKWCPLMMDKETKADDFCSYGERKDAE